MSDSTANSTIYESRGDKVFITFIHVFLLLAMLLALYPLYFTVIASVSDPYKVATGKV